MSVILADIRHALVPDQNKAQSSALAAYRINRRHRLGQLTPAAAAQRRSTHLGLLQVGAAASRKQLWLSDVCP
jgi:hypothetical protein